MSPVRPASSVLRHASFLEYSRPEPDQLSSDLFGVITPNIECLFRIKAKVVTEDQQVFDLTRRGDGDVEKPAIVTTAGSAGPLSDIGRYGHRRSAQLGSEAIAFYCRKAARVPVDRECEFVSSHPHVEAPKVTHPGHRASATVIREASRCEKTGDGRRKTGDGL